ncbi:MAG: CPBP family intramembrane glutamic endopeptidase [Candidatus Neomarinimicrobiota bacterium]|nr:CPBP family intramembrane glutamic endopeptidase [Candidatus Neomarinimicrobiota bacterium]MEE3241835.1 CPBP family intramembrane glutamic endopeptidase [Candidatus Neomarinimicrobiota bacterium]MEE3301611.1 CPBP family intramembrane glutamic endopeptidase [Candidatus Neomarinimicrobiota bacterium]
MIKDYFRKSSSPLYSFIITLPIFLTYELGIFWMRNIEFNYIQNGADVLIEQAILRLGFDVIYVSSIIFLFVLLIIIYYQKHHFNSLSISRPYLGAMLLESIVYASILFFLMGNLYLMDVSTNDFYCNIILSLGAGIYEELIFRVLLIYVFYQSIKFLFRLGKFSTNFYAIILSAILFSSFHFIGAESFNQEAFAVRFIAGIFLAFLYVQRGFGITAITHSFYDIFVIFLLT